MRKAAIAAVGLLACAAQAENRALTNFGDTMAAYMPLAAIGIASAEPGWEGAKQFSLAYVGTKVTTAGLKSAVHKERPDHAPGDEARSFPSGHTANTFAAAGMLHARYGFTYAVVPYMLAGLTGYSRVQAEKHYPIDVLAGAAIGVSWAFWAVDSKIQINSAPHGRGLFMAVTIRY